MVESRNLKGSIFVLGDDPGIHELREKRRCHLTLLLLLLHLVTFLLEQVDFVQLLLDQLLLVELGLLVQLDLLLGPSAFRTCLEHIGGHSFGGFNQTNMDEIID